MDKRNLVSIALARKAALFYARGKWGDVVLDGRTRAYLVKIKIGIRGALAVALLNFLVLAGGIAFAQSQIGESPNFVGWVQDWTLVDDARPLLTITGVVAMPPKVFTESDWADHDWNILLNPGQGLSLVNRDGIRNTNGLIELEIKTSRPEIGGIDLGSYFPEGSLVEARGWWVADGGHDDKTELHPLTYLRRDRDNTSIVFMAQDGSNRFYVAQQPLLQTYTIDLSTQAQHYEKIQSLTSSFDNRLTAIEVAEQARVDHWFGDPSLAPAPVYSGGRSRATANPGEDSVTLSATLPPPFVLPLARPQYFPMYLATYSRSNRHLLGGNIHYTVEREASGRQTFRATVQVDLTAGSQSTDGIAVSRWTYPGGPNGELVTREKRDQHWVSFDAVYAPWQGRTGVDWYLNVTASTRLPEWYPGIGEVPKEGIGGPWRRAWVRDTRIFHLTPSNATLAKTPLTQQVSRGHGNEVEERLCEVGYELILDEHIIKGADVTRKWSVVQILRADGSAASGPISTKGLKIPESGQLQMDGALFMIAPDNPRRLTVIFGPLQWAGDADDLAWPASNRAVFHVNANVETGLGESIGGTERVALPYACYSSEIGGFEKPIGVVTRRPRGLPWTREDVERTLAAMLAANKKGLLPHGWSWPSRPLPVRELQQAFPNGIPRLTHPESFVGSLPPDGKRLLEAFRKVIEGETLQPDEKSLLNASAGEALRLPPFREPVRPRQPPVRWRPAP